MALCAVDADELETHSHRPSLIEKSLQSLSISSDSLPLLNYRKEPLFSTSYLLSSPAAMNFSSVFQGSCMNTELRCRLITIQVEYYFSIDNLCKDLYLRSQMDDCGFVPLYTIAQFNRMKLLLLERYPRMSVKDKAVVEALGRSNVLELDASCSKVRRRDGWQNWLPPTWLTIPDTQNQDPGYGCGYNYGYGDGDGDDDQYAYASVAATALDDFLLQQPGTQLIFGTFECYADEFPSFDQYCNSSVTYWPEIQNNGDIYDEGWAFVRNSDKRNNKAMEKPAIGGRGKCFDLLVKKEKPSSTEDYTDVKQTEPSNAAEEDGGMGWNTGSRKKRKLKRNRKKKKTGNLDAAGIDEQDSMDYDESKTIEKKIEEEKDLLNSNSEEHSSHSSCVSYDDQLCRAADLSPPLISSGDCQAACESDTAVIARVAVDNDRHCAADNSITKTDYVKPAPIDIALQVYYNYQIDERMSGNKQMSKIIQHNIKVDRCKAYDQVKETSTSTPSAVLTENVPTPPMSTTTNDDGIESSAKTMTGKRKKNRCKAKKGTGSKKLRLRFTAQSGAYIIVLGSSSILCIGILLFLLSYLF